VYLSYLSDMASSKPRMSINPLSDMIDEGLWELLLSLGQGLQLRIPVDVVVREEQSDLKPHERDGCASFVGRRMGGKSKFDPSPS
jgi:hypothetical protein